MLEYYTYAWVHPITRIPFYIGKGKGDRCKKPRKTRAGYKLAKLLEEGYKLEDIICILQFYKTEQEAYKDEQRIIDWHKRKEDGGSLLNITEGGDGFTSQSSSFALKMWHRNKTAEQILNFQIKNSAAHKDTVWLNNGIQNIKTKNPDKYIKKGYKLGMLCKKFDKQTLHEISKNHKNTTWINNDKINKKIKNPEKYLREGWNLGMIKRI